MSRVDVLAVMDAAIGQANGAAMDHSTSEILARHVANMREARAAVAELMAERDRYENALYLIANGDLRPGCIGSITKARMGEIARAALARIGGAA